MATTPTTERLNGMGNVITCACGCGARFHEYDDQKRPRRYLPGHNSPLWHPPLPAKTEK